MLRYFLAFILTLSVTYGKLQVTATSSIIGDWVKHVGGDSIELSTLVPAGADMHSFLPTPKDAITLQRADIIFENGLGLEYWLDRLYSASKSKAKRIKLAENLQDLILTHGHTCSHGHCHTEFDPHVWMSVTNVETMVSNIVHSLAAVDPSHAALYKTRGESYIKQLRELDEWVHKEIDQIPQSKRKLLTNHESFNYFGRDYGFKIIGSVLGSLSTDHVDPSASHIAKMSRMINKEGIRAIFGENIQNNTLAREVAKEAGLGEVRTLYTGSLSNDDRGPRSYIDLIRTNVTQIVEGLK